MDYYQNMIQATNEKNSFMLHNGIRLTKMERDHAVVEADLTRVNRNLYGAVHEGWVKSRGTTICIVEVEIRDTSGKVLCGGTFTMFCVGKQDRLADD